MLQVTVNGSTLFVGHLISVIICGFFMYYIVIQIGSNQRDRAKHAGVSVLMTFLSLNLFYFLHWPWWLAPVISMSVGIGKELYDLFDPQNKKFDFMDLLADAIGTGVVLLVYLFSFVLTY